MKSKLVMFISVATLALSAIAPNAMASGKAQASARGPVSIAKGAKSITVSRNAVSKSAQSMTVSRTAVTKGASASALPNSHTILPGANSH